MIPRRLAHLRPSGSPAAELRQYPNALPIFIIGSVRSGTSAMMTALRDGAQIRGFNEGVIAHLLPVLLSAVRDHYASQQQKPMTMIGSVPEEFWATGIKNLFGAAFVETMGEGRWLDKTPGGASIVAACRSLLEIFPNAKFIFCKRRGIENVLSRQNKFAGRDFEAHCRGWALTMEAWTQMAPQLGDSAIMVDQRDMAIGPELIARELVDFLDLSAEQHQGILDVLRGRRIEQTRAVQDDVPISLADAGWTETDQETFRRICGPMMSAYGYDIGGGAAATGKAAYQFFVPVVDGIVQRENVADRKACRPVDATRFKITPNSYGSPPAGVRHRRLDMQGFRRFSAQVRSVGAGAHDCDGVVFRFSIERSGGQQSPVFSAEQIVSAGPAFEWICDLPPLIGIYDAVLSVRPVSGRTISGPLSTLWSDTRLT